MVDTPQITPTNTSPQPGSQPWLPQGLDPELKGWIENRGLDKKTAAEAAIDSINGHRELERHLGAPANLLLRIPKDAGDEAGWNTVYQRLGAPKTAAEYDEPLKAVKFTDGTALDEATTKSVKDFAFKHHLSPAGAAEYAKTLVSLASTTETEDKTTNEQNSALEAKKLNEAWGSNREVNTIIAKNAAVKLGPQYLAAAEALEGAVGYADAMKLFFTLGQLMGEDKFLRDAAPGGAGGFTKDQATSRLAELKADPVWRDAYLKGDAAKVREFKNLLEVSLA